MTPTDTLQALEAIKPETFERLVALFLRHDDPTLTGLIATGLNARGEPITCPVDGILYSPGAYPTVTAVAATTIRRKSLREKWLRSKAGKGELGDLYKAAREFEPWKEREPNINARLYLATNNPLGSDTDLYKEVVQEGARLRIEVHVVEASRLRDFLDFHPEGQYAREQLLGIRADRLSESLLRKIAAESLRLHGQRFSAPVVGHMLEIHRDVEGATLQTIRSMSRGVVGLVGPSGYGKSTLLRQIGYELSRNGEVALWLPADDLSPSYPLASTLLSVLRRFHPGLNDAAGVEFLALAQRLAGGVVLLVDDVNRASSPTSAIQALRMATDAEFALSSSDGAPRLRFVVPLWPEQATGTVAGEGKRLAAHVINLDRYSTRERDELDGSSAGVPRSVTDALGGDPFLCGLWAGTNEQTGGPQPDLLHRLVVRTIDLSIQAALEINSTFATPGEYRKALDELIELSLGDDAPEPSWPQFRAQCGDRVAELLLALAKTNRLGWIEDSLQGEFWRWKHARLRDAVVGAWLARLPVTTRDPYAGNAGLAEAWAFAVAALQVSDRPTLIEWLGEHSPLSLAEVVRLGIVEVGNPLASRIAQLIRSAVEPAATDNHEYVAGPHWLLLARLAQTDSALILEATRDVQHRRWVDEARFRNGEVQAGLNWIARENQFAGLAPAVESSLFSECLGGFSRVRQDRTGLIDELRRYMSRSGSADLAFTLAGYLAWPEFASVVGTIWENLDYTERLRTLPASLWCLSRCTQAGDAGFLRTALLAVRQLSDETKDGSSERANYILRPFRMARQWAFTDEAIQMWADVANFNTDLRQTIQYVLRHHDHPTALEAAIRLMANHLGAGYVLGLPQATQPADYIRFDRFISTCPVTRSRLWQVALDEPSTFVGRTAFAYWKDAATWEEIPQLQSIEPDHPLFSEALKIRVRLGDRTAAGALKEQITSNPVAWCGFAPRLWDQPDLPEVFFAHLNDVLAPSRREKLTPEQYLGAESVQSMLPHLPASAVQRLVCEFHDLLLSIPDTWVQLWRTGVPVALAFVQRAILSAEVSSLDHFTMRAGHFPFPVRRCMLDALTPVIHRFPEREQRYLAELAMRAGMADWAFRCLPVATGKLTENGNYLDEKYCRRNLDEATTKVPQGPSGIERMSGFIRLLYSDSERRALINLSTVVRAWLGHNPSDEQLIVASMVLEYQGVGTDAGWWKKQAPSSATACTTWANTRAILERRLWQAENWLIARS